MIKKHVRYRLNISVYYSFGSIFSTHVEANTEEKLLENKQIFIAEQKKKTIDGKPSVELITISEIIKTTVEYDSEKYESIQLTDKITNSYAPSNIRH